MTDTTTLDKTTTETSAPPTAAQRIVAVMWRLGAPATTKAIAAAAEVGYSTATPILRNLLATDQAVKTEGDNGKAEWQLTATIAPATTENTEPEPTVEPDNPDPVQQPPAASDTTGAATDDDVPDPAALDTSDDEAPHTPGTHAVAADGATAEAAVAIPVEEPPDGGDTAATSARPYRKPAQPRRPKGELRAAVLAVLKAAPDQPFKVTEVCKAIDAANTDGTSNKAGAGAVANALDKLVNSGDAVRVEATYATYQAAG